MPKFHDCEQNTEQWFRLRMGIPTASEVHKIITPGRLTASSQREAYMNRLLCEWALNEPILGDYESDFMLAGKENEPQAVEGFEFIMDAELAKVGFVTDDTGLLGASPDRVFVSGNKGCEVKCPANHTHIGYMLRKQSLIDKYVLQLQTQMLVCGFEENWITSWSAKLPQICIRVLPSVEIVKKLAPAIESFVEEMVEKRLALTKDFGLPKVQEPAARDELLDAYHMTEADELWIEEYCREGK